MKITIVYDNEAIRAGLRTGWGFSALVENAGAPPLLFDTGADGSALSHNMNQLGIDPRDIGAIVISHAHGDHAGGLPEVLRVNQTAELYVPASFRRAFPERSVTVVTESIRIRGNIFSTGELEGIEQSLVLRTDKGIFVLTGCAHPGIKTILAAAAKLGEIYGIAGGFHGFRDFDALRGLSSICPCHCTTHKQAIRNLFEDRALECGAGLVIEL
jgi:7,8-dihydropterin-6-yl-methyl-4-(beta-D-ribofuranosyl)aminobenzene 5'-phosphate synthase